jgi:beta-glucanase (GH16 family)
LRIKIVLVIIGLVALPLGCSIPEKGPFPESRLPGWKLIWSDEFVYSGLPDPSRWDYEVGYRRNNELQYYTAARTENARVENGLLIIETRKEPYRGFDYTSASLITKDKASWVYGRVEVKAKLPMGRGLWPAVWMLGTNIGEVGWPVCGEIDIMENVGFNPDVIHANIHTKAYNHVSGNHRGSNIFVSQPHQDFHVYAIEWFDDRINFFVDDNNYFSYANDGSGWETWPFDQKHYLIINTAVGGSWGGARGVDNTIFPQKFYIDYVRVYQHNRF